MAKVKNRTIHSDDREFLKRVAEELDFLGRRFKLDLRRGRLTQFVLPEHKPKEKGRKGRREARNKRAESAARNN